MKPETRYRIIALMTIPIVLGACQSQLTAEPVATATPSPIPATVTPQPTSTATASPTPTPDYPEQAGNIVDTEMRAGKLYGIDDSGLATVVLNEATQEWEMYERPVFVAGRSGSASSAEISEMVENIDWDHYMQEMRENRLHDTQGNPIPFGYLYETPSQGENPGTAYLSGFVTDYYAREIAGIVVDFVALAIPQRYENQVVVFSWIGDPNKSTGVFIIENDTFSNLGINERPDVLIPASFSRAEAGKLLRSEMRGKQIVIGIGIDYPNIEKWSAFQVQNILARILLEEIINESATELYMNAPVGAYELWFPDLQE